MRPSTWVVLAATLGVAVPSPAQTWKGRARIDGEVRGEDGTPLPGATVRVDRPNGSSPPGPRRVTDARGQWVVDGIASGTWKVVVAAPGYPAEEVGVHIPGESSWLAPLEVRLRRPPPAPAPRVPVDAPPPPARTQEPGTPPASLEDVRAALDAGRVGRARDLAARLGSEETADAQVLFEIGVGFLDAGATAEAASFFDLAVEQDPAHVPAHYRRGLALLALGREDDAREAFEEVVALKPNGVLAARAREALAALGTPAGG